ncbi:DUF397 domain-containing protein [Fodinicola acaciae]|uniref:DUF397 domain-containing protein n=1 Tax=Fodinicola acaciae TaxID=2681555 RepID=UPI0013D44C8B|nr:DUF397 domain-containing protein [Fodinicola acaciae]
MTVIGNWRKSTRSGSQAECVEVGTAGSVVGVRDSKNRNGAALSFSATAWSSFVGQLRGR